MNTPMRYGISAGALILQGERLLLVHHYAAGRFDFWVPPGGKLEGAESIIDCAKREVMEETNLQVEPKHVLYIEEFYEPGYHFCKFFFICDLVGGELDIENRDTDEGFLIEARFFSQEELQGLDVRPAILKDGFWKDRKAGVFTTTYLGLQELRD